MMGTDLTKVSNFVRQFCRPYLLIFLLGPIKLGQCGAVT